LERITFLRNGRKITAWPAKKISPTFFGADHRTIYKKEKERLKNLARLGGNVFVATVRPCSLPSPGPKYLITFDRYKSEVYIRICRGLTAKDPHSDDDYFGGHALNGRSRPAATRQYIHCVVVFIVIPPVSKFSRVGPIVLNHIYPQRKNSYSKPHHQHKFQISNSFHRR